MKKIAYYFYFLFNTGCYRSARDLGPKNWFFNGQYRYVVYFKKEHVIDQFAPTYFKNDCCLKNI